MLKEEEIFKKHLNKENLLGKFLPDHIIWKVVMNSMREFASVRPTRAHLTIDDLLKEDDSECNHHWLDCGNNFFICDNEKCGAWKAL
jgi:hypothetical protein